MADDNLLDKSNPLDRLYLECVAARQDYRDEWDKRYAERNQIAELIRDMRTRKVTQPQIIKRLTKILHPDAATDD